MRWRAALALAFPALIILGADVARRGERFAAFDRAHALGYAAVALASLVAWAALLYAGATNARRALPFVALFTLQGAVQSEFFARYNVYGALDAQINAASIPLALVGSLTVARLVLFAAAWMGIAVTCVAVARSTIPRRGLSWSLGAPLLIAPLALLMALPTSFRGVQSTPPDVLYFHGLRVGLYEVVREAFGGTPRPARIQLRSPAPLPALAASAPRNVLVILQEAVRADVPTAASHRAAPERISLERMRSVSSSTAIALATLWTGLAPTARQPELLSAPILWEYASAAGYRTAYWTSQHPMFANTRLLLQGAPIDTLVWATHLDPLADYLIGPPDEVVTERALVDLDELGEPFFAVAHYSNVHMPRRFDPSRAPFQPTDTRFRRVDEPAQRNYYKNAVHLSDLAVGALIEGVRAHPVGARTVIVYLSDHGEAWLEHAQANDHGQTLYDEEIRIPAWVDAPRGILSADEERHLRDAKARDLFQTDVCPTILDLLGVWDHAALDAPRAKMPGQPLTRAPVPRAPEVLTNVSWAWEYDDPNWAIMRPPLKLLATSVDSQYRCYDLEKDPAERDDLGPGGCGDLVKLAEEVFGMMPRDLGRLRTRPGWGWP